MHRGGLTHSIKAILAVQGFFSKVYIHIAEVIRGRDLSEIRVHRLQKGTHGLPPHICVKFASTVFWLNLPYQLKNDGYKLDPGQVFEFTIIGMLDNGNEVRFQATTVTIKERIDHERDMV